MEKLRDVNTALRAEYGLRRRMLIERAQVQSHAFFWTFLHGCIPFYYSHSPVNCWFCGFQSSLACRANGGSKWQEILCGCFCITTKL